MWPLLLALSGAAPIQGVVEKVVDGNTIVVTVKQTSGAPASEVIRIAGLDCPSVATVSGQLARDRAKTLWPEGTAVVLKPVGKTFKADRQKRTIAAVQWSDDSGLKAMQKDRLCRYRKPKTTR